MFILLHAVNDNGSLNRQFSVHEHQTLKDVPFVTLDHKTILKSLGYICSKSQKYIVLVKIIHF